MFDRSLPSNTRSPRSLFLSVGIHCAAVILLLAVKVTVIDKPLVRNTRILLAPTTPDGPPPKRVLVRTALKLPKLPAMAKLPPPLLAPPPVVPPPMIQPPAIKAPPIPERVAELPSPPVATPKPAVQTDVFSSVAKASAPQAASAKVQTGGFSGASAAAPQSEKVTQIVAAGFGDAGVAPTPGSRRVVANGAGFGDAGVVATAQVTRRGVATPGAGFGDAGVASGPVASKGTVRAGNFGDTVTAAPAAAVKPVAASPTTAAQILEKPKPVYTEEARTLKIEGEVQLEVRFRATGEVEIVRVVRGLGHGLDENAARAARTIRFLPAKRDGQPIDSTATVHITFQLAS